MQLPPTLSPALCCLLALAAKHVAGLGVPSGAPRIRAELGLEVGVDASLPGGGAYGSQVALGLETEGCSTRPQAQRRQLAPAAETASSFSFTETTIEDEQATETATATATGAEAEDPVETTDQDPVETTDE